MWPMLCNSALPHCSLPLSSTLLLSQTYIVHCCLCSINYWLNIFLILQTQNAAETYSLLEISLMLRTFFFLSNSLMQIELLCVSFGTLWDQTLWSILIIPHFSILDALFNDLILIFSYWKWHPILWSTIRKLICDYKFSHYCVFSRKRTRDQTI